MKPAAFSFLSAESTDEALDALARFDGAAKLIAGGQSLAPMLNMRLARPEVLVDINRLIELDGIDAGETDGPDETGGAARPPTLHLGAMTRHRDLETSPLIGEHLAGLAEAAACIGHLSIRNRGTLGGSLAHADPAAELPVSMVALEATVHIASVRGTRAVGAGEFFHTYFTTVLEPDEMIVGVDVPVPGARCGTAWSEFAWREGDYGLAGAFAAAEVDAAGRFGRLRIVVSGVADVPLVLDTHDAVGLGVSSAELDELLVGVTAPIEITDETQVPADYRRRLALEMCRRSVAKAVGRAA